MEQLIALMPLDEPLEDGVIYPSHIVEDACREFEQRAQKRGGIMGECKPPDVDFSAESVDQRYQVIELAKVSHIVRHVWVDSGILKCKVHLLGKYAEIATVMDFEYYGVPRALGSVEDGSKVCAKYTLITVDLSLPELI